MRRALARALALLVALNACFFLLTLLGALVPREALVQRVREAFASGELGTDDYPWGDPRLGIDQFTDCLVLQSALYRDRTLLRSALGQSVMRWDTPGTSCEKLLRAANAPKPPHPDYARYHRYWHGNKVLDSFLVWGLGVGGARTALEWAGYLAVGSLAAAALAHSLRLGAWVAPIALFAACFSSLPFMGRLLSHAPGFIWAFAGTGLLIALPRRLREGERLLLAAVAMGAIGTFVDMLASMPLHVALFFAVTHLLETAEGRPARRALAAAALTVPCTLLGITGSLLLKHLLALSLYGWSEVVTPFVAQLEFRIGLRDAAKAGLGAPLAALWRELPRLTFGVPELVPVPVGLGALGWGALAARTLRAARRGDAAEAMPHAGFALGTLALLLGWYLAFSNHTLHHPEIMNRHLFLVFAIGWSAWLAARSPRPPGRPG